LPSNKRVLTGITTSGIPHIGNLAGAILPAISESKKEKTSSFLFLADYHSLIKTLDPDLTHNSSFEIAACWLACGLDPKTTTFYRQSDVPHIMELAWILSCLTAKGLLNRAHAYKAAVSLNEDKNSQDPDKGITMGLFNYPILMAADILMFNADEVPVGQDQKQHLEMTRDIANRFNHHYGEVFTIPEAVISDETGILPGIDGQKMSKSYDNTIPAFIDTTKLKKLVNKIKTNSLEPGEPKDTEGCTVFSLYKAFASTEQILSMQEAYKNGISWGEAKNQLHDLLEEFISPYREEYLRISKDRGYVEQTLKEGAEKAMQVSSPILESVRKKVGIKGF
jgi:tryptophanyl-tRNA synthetase|tara:strand:- start:4914 stop:5924 length:1011 start_codon:yes stop_codon:yes gene_type:complete